MKNEIEIVVNGQSKKLKEGCSLNQLIDNLGISNKSIAVAINGDVIEKSQIKKYILKNKSFQTTKKCHTCQFRKHDAWLGVKI